MVELRELVDDASIPDDDFVLRLVRPDTIEHGPPLAAKSNAFQQQSVEKAAEYGLGGSCFSVALESVWREQSGKVEDLLAEFNDSYGIVRLSVGKLRTLKRLSGEDQPQGVMRDRRDTQPWHAVVWDLSGKQTKGAMKAIEGAVEDWLYVPAAP